MELLNRLSVHNQVGGPVDVAERKTDQNEWRCRIQYQRVYGGQKPVRFLRIVTRITAAESTMTWLRVQVRQKLRHLGDCR